MDRKLKQTLVICIFIYIMTRGAPIYDFQGLVDLIKFIFKLG